MIDFPKPSDLSCPTDMVYGHGVRTPGHPTSDFVSIFDLDEEKGLINSSLKDWF